MKTILLAVIAFITLAIAAPVAQAGQFARVYTNRGPVYLHKSQLYGGGNYYNNGCHKKYSHRRSNYRSYSRPVYYSRPVNYSRPSYSHYRSSYSNCRPHYGYRTSPRIAVSFGF